MVDTRSFFVFDRVVWIQVMSDLTQKANLLLYRQRLLDLGLFTGNPNQEVAIEHIEMVSNEVSWEELNERLIDVETDI